MDLGYSCGYGCRVRFTILPALRSSLLMMYLPVRVRHSVGVVVMFLVTVTAIVTVTGG